MKTRTTSKWIGAIAAALTLALATPAPHADAAAKKPTERLSGAQKGNVAPSVPASGCHVVVASDRSHNREAPSLPPT